MGSSIFQRPKWSKGFCRGVVQITLQNLFRGGFGLVSMARDIFCGVACMGWGVGAAFSVLLLFACVGPLLCLVFARVGFGCWCRGFICWGEYWLLSSTSTDFRGNPEVIFIQCFVNRYHVPLYLW